MKPLYKLYKKIITESEEDISLDFADDIDESYVELSRHEVENMLNDEINEKYDNMMVTVDGENITVAEIIQDMRPELYKREFDDFCIENDIKKIDGKYYAKTDDPVTNECDGGMITESQNVPTVIKTDTYCDFEISIVPKDKNFEYQLKDTKAGNAESPYIKCDNSYDSIEAALSAAKIHVDKICIKNELEIRKAKLHSK